MHSFISITSSAICETSFRSLFGMACLLCVNETAPLSGLGPDSHPPTIQSNCSYLIKIQALGRFLPVPVDPDRRPSSAETAHRSSEQIRVKKKQGSQLFAWRSGWLTGKLRPCDQQALCSSQAVRVDSQTPPLATTREQASHVRRGFLQPR